MITRLATMGAAVAAAVAAAGVTVWAKRRAEEDAALEQEIMATAEAEADTTVVEELPEPTEVEGDELTVIKGIGKVSSERLRGIGVTTYAQIAGWSDDDLEAASTEIHVSAERIRREDWVGQARAITED